jgi:hypothetical protein
MIKCRVPSAVTSSYSYIVDLTVRGKISSRFLTPYHHT